MNLEKVIFGFFIVLAAMTRAIAGRVTGERMAASVSSRVVLLSGGALFTILSRPAFSSLKP